MSMTTPTGASSRLASQRGFSLMEVLIAMLVLAIGLLGLAALQTQGLRFSNDSYVRSQSTTLAYDIIDTIRVNRANFAAYPRTELELAQMALDNDCDPLVASVIMDLTCWIENIQAAMPGAVASIAVNATDANYLDVSLSWVDREPREYSGGTPAVRLPQNEDECLFPDGDTDETPIPGRT